MPKDYLFRKCGVCGVCREDHNKEIPCNIKLPENPEADPHFVKAADVNLKDFERKQEIDRAKELASLKESAINSGILNDQEKASLQWIGFDPAKDGAERTVKLKEFICESINGSMNRDQPLPVHSIHAPSWPLAIQAFKKRMNESGYKDEQFKEFIADFNERDQEGRKRYGQPLKPFNGRNPAIDLYQELLDTLVYSTTAIQEYSNYNDPAYKTMVKEIERIRERAIDSIVVLRPIIRDFQESQ